MLAQLEEDLLHLEGGGQRLDQDGGAEGAALEAEGVLGEGEHLVPEARLEVVLHLRQVEVGAEALGGEPRGAVEGEEAEVDQRAGAGGAVEVEVALGQVPAARADQQRRRLLVQLVVAAVGAVVGDRPLDRVDQVGVAGDLVRPGRRVGVLEVGHEALGAGVQRVDHQLAVGRAGDLDPAVEVVGARRRGPPGGVLADLARLGEEVERAAGGDRGAALGARGEQLAAGGRRSGRAARRGRRARRRVRISVRERSSSGVSAIVRSGIGVSAPSEGS